jgi:ribulose-phosphate 3-epimerase
MPPRRFWQEMEMDMSVSREIALSPSILNSDLTRLADSLRLLEEAEVEYVHLDVMDGRFVPNISIGIPVVASVRAATRLPLDVHLMIDEPERYISQFIEAGADILTIHVEATRHPHRALQAIRETGIRAGLALNPGTPIAHAIELLALTDLVLVMSVNPGFGGQTFIPTTLRRLTTLRAAIVEGGFPTLIEVDGGVSARNAGAIAGAGTDVLVAGTAIFGGEAGVVAAARQIRDAAGA